jgi:hypothetical protein
VTLRGRHRQAGKVRGGVDGGGVRNLRFSPVAYCVLFFCSSSVTRNGHLVLLLDRQCVGYTITSSNQVAVDSLFLSCLPKNYFLIISAFFKISQIVVFPCMTARKYSWNGGGGKAQGEGREI